ncbi:hypothetical protein SAMN05216548_12620 [Faunimonas pinastri]|uniref:Uncharacterized protein n=1 Tax=Faunimonas pinastri TaxID=1855383 RepID=A0A1H9Q9U0_9HYPH|nr:hypothetical protein [Faunimonas pinastri]SER57197.1 hypothetical protein SAMN05216548_12620 [Faunimonas pinastri]
MIDFDALVLTPAMDAFSRPIIIDPVNSQPGVFAYSARGVWASKPDTIQTEGGEVISTNVPTLGIRLSEFSVAPVQGDQITIPAYLSAPALGTFFVFDVNGDGQGGADLVLMGVSNDT